jgi:type IV pilus assembly protein PilB
MDDFERQLAHVRATSIRQLTSKEAYAEFYQQLLCDSLEQNASRIHLHCSPTELVIRYRILGKLHLRAALPSEAADGLLYALKSHLGLDVLECRRPQDGRASFLTKKGNRKIRVSTITAMNGPSAVLSWEPEQEHLKCRALYELGLVPEHETQVRQMLQRRRGLIVASGPWGNGGRTIGRAALMAARDAGKEVLSLEWGITRLIPGILQCDMSAQADVTRPEWIRAALRRRPDVLLVEYRFDQDTMAEIISAARNNCLVIVSSEWWGFEYWIDRVGTPRQAAVEALAGFIDQRLVPIVCPHCTTYYTPKASELHALRIRCKNPERLSFAKPQGCVKCDRTGRGGLLGVHMVATMTAELQDMFLQRQYDSIQLRLLDSGMITFYQSVVQKLITKKISSVYAVHSQRMWLREPQVWLDVDPDTGSVTRTREPIS